MKTVFTYGSLMYPQVWEKIVRQRYDHLPAVLPAYQRKQVKNAEFPAIVAREESQVSGVAYFNVNHLDMKLLDDFEGEIYSRNGVTIFVNGVAHDAQAYVLRPKFRHLLSRMDWEPEHFVSHQMQAFIKRTLGHR